MKEKYFLSKFGKCVFLLFLFSCFILLFGWPALSTFLESKVMIHTSDNAYMVASKRKVSAPTITFCPKTMPSIKSGWKNISSKHRQNQVLETQCGTTGKTAEDILECIEKKTYDLNETILSAEMGISEPKNLLGNSTSWSWDVSYTNDGRCHTFKATLFLEANMDKGALIFGLNQSLGYTIYIHDPHFFLLSSNPITIPEFKVQRNPDQYGGRKFYSMNYIRVTKYIKMNRKDAPCMPGSEYNFMKCLKTSVSNKVGCRQEWDVLTDKEIQKCKFADQLLAHEALYHNLAHMEQRDLVETTGCSLPCEFLEYQQQGEQYMYGNTFGLGVIFATTEVLFKEDILVYPPLSFIAEFGGALGLFLGFSFNMIWDFFSWAVESAKIRFSN